MYKVERNKHLAKNVIARTTIKHNHTGKQTQ